MKTKIYDPKIDSIDWEKVQSIIDIMRGHTDEKDFQLAFSNRINTHLAQWTELVDDGWPFQEIQFDKHDEPIGMPIELAYMLLGIFEYCAYANIDIAAAIKLIQDV